MVKIAENKNIFMFESYKVFEIKDSDPACQKSPDPDPQPWKMQNI